ncbi:MAG: hypothetical protein U1F77_11890 [Kiritimatiellia bacterium]
MAGRMFSRGWCQENFFGYMMEHYDIDGLVEYGSEEIPGTTPVVNPALAHPLDKQVKTSSPPDCANTMRSSSGPPLDPDDGKGLSSAGRPLESIQGLQAERDELKRRRAAMRPAKSPPPTCPKKNAPGNSSPTRR